MGLSFCSCIRGASGFQERPRLEEKLTTDLVAPGVLLKPPVDHPSLQQSPVSQDCDIKTKRPSLICVVEEQKEAHDEYFPEEEAATIERCWLWLKDAGVSDPSEPTPLCEDLPAEFNDLPKKFGKDKQVQPLSLSANAFDSAAWRSSCTGPGVLVPDSNELLHDTPSGAFTSLAEAEPAQIFQHETSLGSFQTPIADSLSANLSDQPRPARYVRQGSEMTDLERMSHVLKLITQGKTLGETVAELKSASLRSCAEFQDAPPQTVAATGTVSVPVSNAMASKRGVSGLHGSVASRSQLAAASTKISSIYTSQHRLQMLMQGRTPSIQNLHQNLALRSLSQKEVTNMNSTAVSAEGAIKIEHFEGGKSSSSNHPIELKVTSPRLPQLEEEGLGDRA
ncbi:hypothetical protein CEUSTIGMA_g2042.t1 [Chlamydomonas eustigma]|uniref:Uncharacterized protein n=1 Tax=Chlamydomonas eustigma TaxID=1157962 RepID=A0A250WUT3_9CHLO|nr:hypothetical protein CEUSTIGMA_g2042.t1 [Chlamydomonas eustigma]|eukprot:GAX74594.1 hypothetical protein CEUSTIGMA_g2042.t1 [Chlamydomonas eustigma]